MSLRSADLRFVLAHDVRSATVLGGPTEVGAGLQAAGVDLSPTGRPVDLVVSDAARAPEALALPARSHLVLGAGTQGVARWDGGPWQPLLVRGGVGSPSAVLPLDSRMPLRHFLATTAVRPGGLGLRLRRRAMREGLTWVPVRLLPRVANAAVRGRASRDLPRFLSEARDFGVPADAGWALTLGTGDDLQRAVFHVLDGPDARWVVKLSRVPGAVASFDRDEAGLRLVAGAGDLVSRRAPRLVGRFEVDGLPASLETSGRGPQLVHQLSGESWDTVWSVAAWVVDVGQQTAQPARALVDELDRLERDVLPAWCHAGAPADLVARLRDDGGGGLVAPRLPAVLAHHDLGTWNVVADGTDFTVVDWESAAAAALPLWDLVYFLGDALPRAQGAGGPGVLLERCLELFRGRAPGSPALFRWLRELVGRLAIPPETVGAVVTLCWLHHGLSAVSRGAALAGAEPAPLGHLARMAGPWLADPDLGPDWSTWRSG